MSLCDRALQGRVVDYQVTHLENGVKGGQEVCEGGRGEGITRGAGTLVRRTAIPWCVRLQMSVCVRAQRVLVSLAPDQGRKCAHIRLSPFPASPSFRRSADVARAVHSLRRARAPGPLLPLETKGGSAVGRRYKETGLCGLQYARSTFTHRRHHLMR